MNELIKVTIDENFKVDKALRKFKKLCDMYGVTREYRQRKHHRKPSIARKEKLEQAEKRRKKLERKIGSRYRQKI